jgi:hypothetical protein
VTTAVFEGTKISTACALAQTLCGSAACLGASLRFTGMFYTRGLTMLVTSKIVPHCTMAPGLFPWESGQGVALTTHPPTSAKFKEGAELYLCSPTGPSGLVLTFTVLWNSVAESCTTSRPW